MSADTLYCRCGGEVRLVRLNRDYLTLGHVNGGRAGHYVRLAKGDVEGPGLRRRPSVPHGSAKGRRGIETPLSPRTPQAVGAPAATLRGNSRSRTARGAGRSVGVPPLAPHAPSSARSA